MRNAKELKNKQNRDTHYAYDVARLHEGLHCIKHQACVGRREMPGLDAHYLHQLCFVYHLSQQYTQYREHRDSRKEDVVAHTSCQKDATITHEIADDAA
ncbi:MAG: hypothetical protein SV429_07015 [Pseudomonadota bacterium]|nr:hypothetical protein [Pseudomonadota bacterium]